MREDQQKLERSASQKEVIPVKRRGSEMTAETKLHENVKIDKENSITQMNRNQEEDRLFIQICCKQQLELLSVQIMSAKVIPVEAP